MTEHIIRQNLGPVLVLTLNRPEKRNALTDAMYGSLADALIEAGRGEDIRCILLRGEGNAFTAGNDIADFAGATSERRPEPTNVVRFLEALVSLPIPVVAAVQGHAVGVGTTILLHCDYVVLADDAQLSVPFVNLALVPEAGSSLLLPTRIGHARAFGMFVLGETLAAADAIMLGLANRMTSATELDEVAREVTTRIARQPTAAVRATKRLMRDKPAVLARMSGENAAFAERLHSADAREAFAAFSERRAPRFA